MSIEKQLIPIVFHGKFEEIKNLIEQGVNLDDEDSMTSIRRMLEIRLGRLLSEYFVIFDSLKKINPVIEYYMPEIKYNNKPSFSESNSFDRLKDVLIGAQSNIIDLHRLNEEIGFLFKTLEKNSVEE